MLASLDRIKVIVKHSFGLYSSIHTMLNYQATDSIKPFTFAVTIMSTQFHFFYVPYKKCSFEATSYP